MHLKALLFENTKLKMKAAVLSFKFYHMFLKYEFDLIFVHRMLISLCYSLADPCYGTTVTCDQAYSYRHRLALTSKIEDFEVKSSNIDYRIGCKKTNLTLCKTH